MAVDPLLVLMTAQQFQPSTKLFRGSSAQARSTIQQILLTQGHVVVSFLYFAQAMKFDLYKTKLKHSSDTRLAYQQALSEADLLLIDGIALQIFDRVGQWFFAPNTRARSHNLNGTDFLPYILDQTQDQKVGIVLSSVYDPKINK